MKEEAENRYLERALSEEIGGEHAPDLSERILASASRTSSAMPARGRTGKLGRRAPLPHPARSRSPFGAIVAVLLLIVAGVAVAIGVNTTRPTESRETADKGNVVAPHATPRVEPHPEPRPEVPANTPPSNEPAPEQPKPEEKPELPPAKPDEVKKPEEIPPEKQTETPKQPEGTEVKKPPVEPKPEEKPAEPRLPAVVATVKESSRRNALKIRYAEAEVWRVAETGEDLREGVQLSASGHADVQLSGGALLRFNGEITLGAAIELKSEDLYVDNLDCAELQLKCGELSALMNGIALFSASRGSLGIACVQGSVSTHDGSVSAGKTASLTARGLSKPQPTNTETLARKHAMLRNLPQRVLVREEFDAASKERLDKGELADGVAVANAKEAGVSIYFANTFKVRPGDVVRFRYRISRAIEEMVLQFGVEGEGNYRLMLTPTKVGEWQEVEVALTDLVRTVDKTSKIEVGSNMKFFQLWAVAPQAVKLEVDWFEISRKAAD